MAKKAPLGEAPYRPLLDAKVMLGALNMATPGGGTLAGGELLPRMEAVTKSMDASKQGVARERSSSEGTPRPLSIAPKAAVEFADKLDQEKRMLLTRAESIALDRLVSSLAARLNTQVKLSHVRRSLVALALNAEGEIDQRAG